MKTDHNTPYLLIALDIVSNFCESMAALAKKYKKDTFAQTAIEAGKNPQISDFAELLEGFNQLPPAQRLTLFKYTKCMVDAAIEEQLAHHPQGEAS